MRVHATLGAGRVALPTSTHLARRPGVPIKTRGVAAAAQFTRRELLGTTTLGIGAVAMASAAQGEAVVGVGAVPRTELAPGLSISQVLMPLL